MYWDVAPSKVTAPLLLGGAAVLLNCAVAA